MSKTGLPVVDGIILDMALDNFKFGFLHLVGLGKTIPAGPEGGITVSVAVSDPAEEKAQNHSGKQKNNNEKKDETHHSLKK